MFALIFIFVSIFCSPVISLNRKIAFLQLNRNYGPYQMITRSLYTCEPSVPFDEANKAVNVSLKVIKLSRTKEDYIGNYTFRNDVKITRTLIVAEIQRNGGVFLMEWKKNVNKPCENLFFSYILNQLMKTDSNCVIKKGTHKLENIRANMIAHKVFQGLNYRTYRITLEYYGVKGAIACAQMVCEVKPIKNRT